MLLSARRGEEEPGQVTRRIQCGRIVVGEVIGVFWQMKLEAQCEICGKEQVFEGSREEVYEQYGRFTEEHKHGGYANVGLVEIPD